MIWVASGLLVAMACTAGGGKERDGDGDGDSSVGNGAGDGAGGTNSDIDVGLGGSGAGSTLPPGNTIEDPPLVMCETPTDCCEEIEGCEDPSQFVCTVDGYCGLIKSTCTEQSDCQADTYCCASPDCSSSGDSVCIPANVPPGAPCSESVELGVFAPSVQCEWLGPGANEPEPDSKNVSVTPMVADLPIPSGEITMTTPSGTSAEIVLVTWESGNGDGSVSAPGVIRILDGQSCTLLHSIVDSTNQPRGISAPALADLDNNGTIEIVARRDAGGVVAYEYNEITEAYEVMWAQTAGAPRGAMDQDWDGPSVHDLDDDGDPEVLVADAVFNGQTGAVIKAQSANTKPFNGIIPVAADLDDDGLVELSAVRFSSEKALFSWSGSDWVHDQTFLNSFGSHYAIADMGSEGATENDFDPTSFDGIAEVISINDETGLLTVHTVTSGHLVMNVATSDRGGPPNVGDFDGDGRPEIGVAGMSHFRVFDFDCPSGCNGESPFVRWAQPSQDASSAQTGATIFDFDGDYQAEVVYADECFLRVYDGSDGAVVYSNYRTSGTWYESPLVADVDRDQNTEIVVNNALTSDICAAGVDPIHPGIPCDTDDECPGASTCGDGYCRCTTDTDCQGVGGSVLESGLTCDSAIAPASGEDVCRSTHPGPGAALTGIRVLRDSLDRWASSRAMWNQQAYSITNVNDDGSIPRTSEWLPNWTQPGLNNYRQNRQGEAGFSDLPDITGRFADDDACVTGSNSSKVFLQATVCNRGKRAVGAELPATFYRGDPSEDDVLCTSYTDGPVPTGGCKLVYCEIGSDAAGEEITIVVNDDGNGGRSTVECRPDNNTDSTIVDSCVIPVPR